jgi:hypothetical protein
MAPPPPPAPASSGKRGCVIAAVIVLLLLLVGCVGGVYYCATHAGKLMTASLGALRVEAERSLADDVPPELRDELWKEWDAYASYVEGFDAMSPPPGTDPNKLVLPMQQIPALLGDKRLTADEVRTLITSLREARGARGE